MQISNKFLDVSNIKSLNISISPHEYTLYLINDGCMEKIYSKTVEVPVYSDREGFLKRRGGASYPGHGGDLGSGSVYESKEHIINRELMTRFKHDLNFAIKKNDVKTLILFCPSEIKNIVMEILDKFTHNNVSIKYYIDGNYTHSHENDLLEAVLDKINEEKSKMQKPIKEDARKILDKPMY